MKLECVSMGALCELGTFEINGIKAEWEEFGTKSDRDPENAEEYGCGDMRFEPFPYIKVEVLKKYGITKEEAREVCKKISEEISFGDCGWCA